MHISYSFVSPENADGEGKRVKDDGSRTRFGSLQSVAKAIVSCVGVRAEQSKRGKTKLDALVLARLKKPRVGAPSWN